MVRCTAFVGVESIALYFARCDPPYSWHMYITMAGSGDPVTDATHTQRSRVNICCAVPMPKKSSTSSGSRALVTSDGRDLHVPFIPSRLSCFLIYDHFLPFWEQLSEEQEASNKHLEIRIEPFYRTPKKDVYRCECFWHPLHLPFICAETGNGYRILINTLQASIPIAAMTPVDNLHYAEQRVFLPQCTPGDIFRNLNEVLHRIALHGFLGWMNHLSCSCKVDLICDLKSWKMHLPPAEHKHLRDELKRLYQLHQYEGMYCEDVISQRDVFVIRCNLANPKLLTMRTMHEDRARNDVEMLLMMKLFSPAQSVGGIPISMQHSGRAHLDLRFAIHSRHSSLHEECIDAPVPSPTSIPQLSWQETECPPEDRVIDIHARIEVYMLMNITAVDWNVESDDLDSYIRFIEEILSAIRWDVALPALFGQKLPEGVDFAKACTAQSPSYLPEPECRNAGFLSFQVHATMPAKDYICQAGESGLSLNHVDSTIGMVFNTTLMPHEFRLVLAEDHREFREEIVTAMLEEMQRHSPQRYMKNPMHTHHTFDSMLHFHKVARCLSNMVNMLCEKGVTTPEEAAARLGRDVTEESLVDCTLEAVEKLSSAKKKKKRNTSKADSQQLSTT